MKDDEEKVCITLHKTKKEDEYNILVEEKNEGVDLDGKTFVLLKKDKKDR